MTFTNPYKERGILPIDSDMFFGRDREIQEIKRMLSGASPQSVSIIGEWGIGKSSLAYRVYHKMRQSGNTLAVYLDGDRIAGQCENKEQFYQLLNRECLEALKNNPRINLEIKEAHLFKNYPSFADFI